MLFAERPPIASILQSAGILRALELRRRAPGLLVLNYHRVGDIAGNPFDDGTFSATAETFRAQLAYIRRWFATPAPHEIVESLERRHFADPTVLITFDDGYRDNYDVAFPILRELNVPACFFVVTGLLDAPGVPWWDRVAYSVKRTRREMLTIEYPERLAFDLRRTSRERTTWRILRACKDAHCFDVPRFYDELAARTGVDVDSRRLGAALFMPWRTVRDMAAAGMTIGSHTVSHPVLASLSEAGQRREIEESRDRIGETTGADPVMLAYPVGGSRSYTGVTKRLACEAGYRAGFRNWGGFNRPATISPFEVARMPVERDDTRAQFRLRVTLATRQQGL